MQRGSERRPQESGDTDEEDVPDLEVSSSTDGSAACRYTKALWEGLPPVVVTLPGTFGTELVGPVSERDIDVSRLREQTMAKIEKRHLLGDRTRPECLNREGTEGFIPTSLHRERRKDEESKVCHDETTNTPEDLRQLSAQFKDVYFDHRQITITTYLAYFCFLVCGIGYQIQFSAIASAIIYFQELYGPSIFRIFVGVYNAPLLPISILQLLVDQRLDMKFGSLNMFRIRVLVTFSIGVVTTFAIPFVATPMGAIVTLVGLLGVMNGITAGAILALVSVFPVRTPIFWSIGQRLSTALILATQFTLGTFVMSESGEDKIYFIVCGCISALGIVSFLILIHLTVTRYNLRARDCELKARKREKEMMREREEAIAINTAASLDDFKAASKCNNEPGNKTNKRSSTWRLWLKVLPTAIAGFLILFSDVGVLTILTYVPSSTDNSNIALILIYISYFGDFAGRQLTLLPKKVVWNQTSHLISAIFRFLWVPGIVVYIKQDYWWNDWFVYVFIGTFAVIGGYIRTLIFTIGPQVVSLEDRPKVSLILNFGVTMGTYGGIAYSFIIDTPKDPELTIGKDIACYEDGHLT